MPADPCSEANRSRLTSFVEGLLDRHDVGVAQQRNRQFGEDGLQSFVIEAGRPCGVEVCDEKHSLELLCEPLRARMEGRMEINEKNQWKSKWKSMGKKKT